MKSVKAEVYATSYNIYLDHTMWNKQWLHGTFSN